MLKLKENTLNICIFTLCTVIIFAKMLMFNHYAYHEVWQGVWEKLSVALLISSLVFLFKDKRWILPFMLFVDAWCVANLVYVRSNNLILDGFALTMAGGMNGFWDSIFIFFQPSDAVFFLMTILLGIGLCFIKKQPRSPKLFFMSLAIAVTFNYIGEAHAIIRAEDKTIRDDFSINIYTRVPRENVYGNKLLDEACRTSIMHTLVYTPLDYFALVRGIQPKALPISQEQDAFMKALIKSDRNPQTNSPLLILIVESLESWVCNPYVMPHLSEFIQNQHVFYADKVECQTIGAESADGQMIIVSGLLPTHEGATCFRFPENEYPSVMKAQSNKSFILLPHDESVWNQVKMTPAYGIDTTIFISPVDSLLYPQINSVVESGAKAVIAVTMSTHSPFKTAEKYSSLSLPNDMPYGMYNYVRSFNTVDKEMNRMLDKILTDSLFGQFTVVITGDHTIFHKERRMAFAKYADSKQDFPFSVNEGYVPLIVYSPKIEHNTQYTDVCYQSDIYPTIMYLIGADNYYWQGFGINLTSSANIRRRASEEELLDLSDRVIMNNYFAE